MEETCDELGNGMQSGAKRWSGNRNWTVEERMGVKKMEWKGNKCKNEMAHNGKINGSNSA